MGRAITRYKVDHSRTALLCGCKPWNEITFDAVSDLFTYYCLISGPELLTQERLEECNPQYIFFLHWNWKVPKEITDKYECINFHMTDLPFGRGGSPLQNLILRGNTHTTLTAHRMTDELDAGPVYLKTRLSLKGRAQEIYEKAARLSARMIHRIVTEGLEPSAQTGEVVYFKRRTPEQSEIPENVEDMYDFLRMLDAQTYPNAFLRYAGYRFEFWDVHQDPENFSIDCRVQITEDK